MALPVTETITPPCPDAIACVGCGKPICEDHSEPDVEPIRCFDFTLMCGACHENCTARDCFIDD